MVVYSAVCAVQNSSACGARGRCRSCWVSILDPDVLRETLHIPKHIVPVAYLCLGYVDRFATEPDLERAGWEQRAPLESVLHYERFNAGAETGEKQ